MTDLELAERLGISHTPGWESVIRTLSRSQREALEQIPKTITLAKPRYGPQGQFIVDARKSV